MSTLLLADDLSGALEAGAAFCRPGRSVILPLTAAGQAHVSPGTLRVINTDSRHLAPEEAAARVRAALAAGGGGVPVFKKIDSTLRGPVAAELQALLAALGPDSWIVLCPANPPVGRTVLDSVVLVDGRPVAATEFGADPVAPVQESNLLALLHAGGIGAIAPLRRDTLVRGPEHVAARLRRARQGGVRVIVGDATCREDLDTLVKAAATLEPPPVFAGSGGLARAVARAEAEASSDAADAAAASGRLLPGGFVFLCGSKHVRSHRQFARLAEAGGVRSWEAAIDTLDVVVLADQMAGALAQASVVAVSFRSGAMAEAHAARAIPAAVGDLGRALVEKAHPTGWFATGGETALALCAALDADALEVVEELAPGIVAAWLHGRGEGAWLITKPGGYGAEDALLPLLSRLDCSSSR